MLADVMRACGDSTGCPLIDSLYIGDHRKPQQSCDVAVGRLPPVDNGLGSQLLRSNCPESRPLFSNLPGCEMYCR